MCLRFLHATGQDPEGFVENEDFVEMAGVRIYKPFVEKPSWADNHNVYIYYPHSMVSVWGGCLLAEKYLPCQRTVNMCVCV